jgi:hypothetical protein
VNETKVRALVEQLGSGSGDRRRAARERLSRMGEEIVPLLQRIAADDPDVRRALRQLTRSARRVRVVLPDPPATQRLGQPLVLAVDIYNETEDTWYLPLTRTVGRFGKTYSSFALDVEDGDTELLTPDQVEPAADVPNPAIVAPGQRLRFTIRLQGAASPLRRPGRATLTVLFEHPAAWFWFGRRPPQTGLERAKVSANVQRVLIKAEPLEIEAKGSAPAALEAALRGGDAEARAAALAEIELRDDAKLVPLLRRHAGDKDLRLTAVRRLGEAAAPEDFRLVYDAARDPDPEVRKAAVLALGNYPGRKARSRLIGFVQDRDAEFTRYAVQALRKHKHPVTIDCFIVVMRRADERLMKQIADVIWDWTGKPISNRRSEVERFAEWWVRNRAAWARENLPRK